SKGRTTTTVARRGPVVLLVRPDRAVMAWAGVAMAEFAPQVTPLQGGTETMEVCFIFLETVGRGITDQWFFVPMLERLGGERSTISQHRTPRAQEAQPLQPS